MSEFERLRDLLLAPERARLDQHARTIEQVRQAQQSLPQRLPQLLEAAERGEGREALHRALAPVVAAALTDAVRRDRRTIVDALFPIIGPTIRKAIAEALRTFVGDLNRALEQSLSMRGWAWRFEAWRSRVPYAQVVVKHTLRYRIDHLFLIERESGLLLHRYSAPELPDLDADAIAGMLTAIGDFVRDSVQAEGDSDGGLASATVGEHLLQVHEGPQAVLACFVRGVPPSALADELREGLENLHRGQAAAEQAHAGFDWNEEATREFDIGALAHLGNTSTAAPTARWPMLLVGLALLLLLLSLGARSWQLRGEEQRLRAAVEVTPGWQLLTLERGRGWSLRLLRDPESAETAELASRAGIGDGQLAIEEVPYLALDDAALTRRLLRALPPTPDAKVEVVAGIARVSGRAPEPWVAQLRERVWLVAGIRALDTDALTATLDPALAEEWLALKAEIERTRMGFVRGGVDVQQDAAPQLAHAMRRALELSRMLNRSLSFRVQGWSDEGGSDRRNRDLRARRAERLRQALLAAGVPQPRLALGADDAVPTTPSASVRWVEGEAPMTEQPRKICLLGDFAVGKSSLVARFVRNTFSDKYLTTVGVKVDSKVVDLGAERAVKLVVWDLAGKAELDSLNRGYIRGAHGLMLVADGTREASLRAALYLWMQSQKQLPGVPVVMLVNKLDLIDRWEISTADVARLQDSLPTFRTSALGGDHVEEAFATLARAIVERGT